jgi:AcrR family transcriptional regulator
MASVVGGRVAPAPFTRADTADAETRARVLGAAARLFAERGFKDVTVREICRAARANVAAVNYHYGDKFGLYQEVIRTAIHTMQETTELAKAAGAGKKPDDMLRAYIRVFLERVTKVTDDSWIHQLMMREMADPTPALDLVFDEVIVPRLAHLGEIVAAILRRPVSDAAVKRSVLSIQSQCHAALAGRMTLGLVPNLADRRALDHLVDHIATFSLGGLRAVRGR